MSTNGPIYLDHNATTPVADVALEAMNHAARAEWANPSSVHHPGVRARAIVDGAREAVAGVLGVRPGEIVFTSSGTESVNHAIRGAIGAARGVRRIVTTAVEHSSVLDCCTQLEASGVEVVRLPVATNGGLDLDGVEAALDGGAALFSIMTANNETGVLHDVDTLGGLARDRGIPVHVDAIQSVGKGFPDLRSRPIDLVSFSGHKFGAPKGSAGLWCRRGVGIRPLIWGGHHERGRRGGTENVPGIAALAAALSDHERRWSVARLDVARRRDHLEASILDALPDVIVAGADSPRAENTSLVCFRGIEGAAVVLTLSGRGIHVSSGSACTEASPDGPSHVLEAMAIPGDHIHGAVRFSLGLDTADGDIERAIEEVRAAVTHVRRVG